MKKPLPLLPILALLLLVVCNSVFSQTRPFTPRYSNNSVRGNIRYVSNNSITTQGGVTTENPPGGSATNNGGGGVHLDVDNTLFPYGSGWKYLDNNTRPANWQTSGYNDASWASGNGELGYGDGDEATVVSYGGNASNKYITTLFRKQFTLASLSGISSFNLNIKRDDGIVVYLNGVEVGRSNMPGGTIVHSTLASSAVDGSDELITINVPAASFVVGSNTFAVEIHQSGNTSSDISFDMELMAVKSTSLINYTDSWKYLDNNTRPANWQTSGYNDASWASGSGELGYGDGDEAAVVSYGGNASNKYITTYFRKTITISNPAAYTSFLMNIIRDDGVVVYVNGVEVGRDNMPAGTPAQGTLASSNIAGASETTPVSFTLSPAVFSAGSNTIAVEMHQDVATSSDLSFSLQLLGMDDETFNSTAADLNLASCSEVLWAGLYWGSSLGNSSNTSWRVGYDTVLLKIPGAASYTKVVSTQTELHENGVGSNHNGYTAFADVTSLINTSNPNGSYTIANVVAPVSTGISNQAAGWTLVIVFRNDAEIPRNLVVFDGFEIVETGSQKDITIAGFVTPLVGPVTCELGAVCYDGDRGSSDGFFFKQDSAAGVGVFTDLSNTGASGNQDTWNSTISYLGNNVTTRLPAHANTLGYDADIIELPNAGNAVLGNNKTSARIRISSPSSGGENFFLHVVTSSISVANPSFQLIKSATDLSGGSWIPDDSLRYKLVNTNTGTDTSLQTIIIDTLPGTVVFKPGSLSINNISKTDAAGDDEAEYDAVNHRVIFRIGTGADASNGGSVIPGRVDSVSFTVNAINSCQILACTNTASNEARIDYVGKNSGLSLHDRSGYLSGGCFVPGPIVNFITGTCSPRADTSLVNNCPLLYVNLPAAQYNGFTFYRNLPFNPANEFDPATPITSSGTYYAHYDAGAGCSDTVRLIVLIQPCPDIDDDDDGIPDYVESNGSDAFADDDLDGIPNFTDSSFPGFVDSNADGVNDNFDSDLDGVPNQIDLDSDNDGIPDVVEAGGVDANGDGRIDNFTDTDNDGLSQNVDANSSGQPGSGNGLGLPDLDGDGVPNYIDLDSDNDGIPDVAEAGGADANNDGRIDGYTDTDGDGFSDNVDGDTGNDGIAENSGNALLRTGADITNDGRADSYPYHNMDADGRANPYDLDSDGDGITDVREAGFTDADSNGFADGSVGADGWNDSIDALGSLGLTNTDSNGNPDYLDIDSDNDGIPDNVEGPSTSGYALPLGTDADNDGIDDAYDANPAFGGNGNTPNDQDADGTPDYRDLDTDNDGVIDRIEGNDFNFNDLIDDNVTLTGTDTDGDGLDDRFDNDNASAKGTSAYMGNGGTLSGDGSPGSITVVQGTISPVERDWRLITHLLDVNFIRFTAQRFGAELNLLWTVTCDKQIQSFEIERSVDGIRFNTIAVVAGPGHACIAEPFSFTDPLSEGIPASQFYYRVKAVSVDGNSKRTAAILVRLKQATAVTLSPNPAASQVQVTLLGTKPGKATLSLLDATGKLVLQQQQQVELGYNRFTLTGLGSLQQGIYLLRITTGNEQYTEKLVIRK